MISLEHWLKLAQRRVNRTLPDGRVIDEVSPNWSYDIRRLWSKGARFFGKVPAVTAQVNRLGEIIGESKAVGGVRSLLDPERCPEGAEFVIAWNDGSGWHHEIPEYSVPIEVMLTEEKDDDGILKEVVCADGETPLSKATKAHIEDGNKNSLKLLEDYSNENTCNGLPNSAVVDYAKRLISSGDTSLALAVIFQSGFGYGQKKLRELLAEESFQEYSQTYKQELVRVADSAILRHGNLTPTQLLVAMGGKRKIIKGRTIWCFRDLSEIEQADFSSAVKEAKRRIDSKS